MFIVKIKKAFAFFYSSTLLDLASNFFLSAVSRIFFLILILFGVILGGILGNLIDRVFRGYVIDYISFTLFNREMAVFNAADIFITFGVILLMYIILRDGRSERISSRRKR